jgi:hypothetical protein
LYNNVAELRQIRGAARYASGGMGVGAAKVPEGAGFKPALHRAAKVAGRVRAPG